MSHRNPNWNTKLKIPYFKLYKCYSKNKLCKVQIKVTFLLAEDNLSSVDTALQARGHIRSVYTHITPNEKLAFCSFIDPKAILDV